MEMREAKLLNIVWHLLNPNVLTTHSHHTHVYLSILLIAWIYLETFTGPVLNPSPENTRSSNTEYTQPRDGVNPNNVFGYPSSGNYPHMNPAQIPLDIPRLPDNRQVFPSMPRDGQSFGFHHPDLTPPPNVFAPYRPPTTTTNPNFLDHFFTGKQQGNNSTINNANLNLTLLSSLFLLFYRIANKFTWISVSRIEFRL